MRVAGPGQQRIAGLGVVVALLLALLVAVQAWPERTAMAAGGTADDHIDRVVVISVDGLNPDAIRALGASGTPTFHRLMAAGTSTLNARTAVERTETLPNHTGMLTGRKIADSADGHGVDFNVDSGSTVHRAAGEYVASVFDVVHDRGRKTALYASKPKFALYDRTWSANGRRDTVGADNGRDKISRYVMREDETALTASFVDRLTTRGTPAYLFLHLRGPDHAGHEHGFMTSRQYLDAVRAADHRVGQVLAALRSQARLRDHTALIVTADHGGYGMSHADPTTAADYTVPFFVWGKGIPGGVDLYALNPAYADPGTSRPGYGVSPQPIRNAAAANLALDLLDLPAVPGSQVNTRMSLRVFR